MIALDTNILARFLLRDHEKQYHTAVSLLQQDRIYTAPPSVILEEVGCFSPRSCRLILPSRPGRIVTKRVAFGSASDPL